MARITEIAEGVHRISILLPQINLQFNHFLVVDEEWKRSPNIEPDVHRKLSHLVEKNNAS